MNILTDEEILAAMTPEAVEGGLVPAQTFARAVEAAVLAKLAALDVEPVAWMCWLDGDTERKPNDAAVTRFEPVEFKNRTKLYTETQLIAVQQKTAEACAKLCGEIISPRKALSDHPYQAWLAGTTQCAEAINNGEWKEYL